MVTDTRYVVGTALGKQLFIKREPKPVQKSDNKIEYSYELTPNLLEATKCVNKVTADTLIEYYLNETKSTKTFIPMKLAVTYELVEGHTSE